MAETRFAQGRFRAAVVLFRENLANGDPSPPATRRDSFLGLAQLLASVDALSGTPPHGCSVLRGRRDGLRLAAPGPNGRKAGFVRNPAREKGQNVKVKRSDDRSTFFTDERNRADGRTTFCTRV